MNFIKKSWYKLVLFIFTLIVSFPKLYAATCVPSAGKICNPVPKITSIPNLIQTILEGALKIGFPIVALAIIYCGFLFVSARGKPEEITKAKGALSWTLVGAAILLGSWAIAKLISATVLAL